MRLTEFHELMGEHFGAPRADSIMVDHVMTDIAGMTPARAIDAGIEPKQVWLALCHDFEVPRDRW